MPTDTLLIWAGAKAVHSSGTVMTFGDQGLDLDVFIKSDLARVRFEFLTDSGAVRGEYGTTPAGPDNGTPATAHLRFFNLHFAGVFADGPIRLGTVGGHSLWIVYEVTPVVGSNGVKKITYTFWEGPPSDQSGSVILPGAPRG
jgi:hypothetical protein